MRFLIALYINNLARGLFEEIENNKFFWGGVIESKFPFMLALARLWMRSPY